jgi:murein DD-endopeptidase MepM/ murein hydrolase activator NlpD
MNQTVAAGQVIGVADNSGDYPPGNDHLHYEIRGCASTSGGCYGTPGFDPKKYLPKPVPDGCYWNCNVNTGP